MDGVSSRLKQGNRRASYFASRVVSKCEFLSELVGCSVSVLSAGPLCPQDRSTVYYLPSGFPTVFRISADEVWMLS